jgi:heterodisulfide reductase subunit C
MQTIDFATEIANLHPGESPPLTRCIQCAVCASACPAVYHMDYTPRKLIAMISAGWKDEVLASNTFWTCASCFACTERCPEGLKPAEMMYALKRYSLWKGQYREGLVGPDFSRRFVKTIVRNGKSYEPGYAPAFIWEGGFPGVMQEVKNAMRLLRRGRLPLIPSRIDRVKNFREMIGRILPLEGIK